MLRRTARYSAPPIFVICAALVSVSAGCENDVVVAEAGEAGVSPSFVTPDAATPEPDRLTAYCPSSNCPAGHTTCPGSYFPCDVDLRTDRDNCGACGAACPQPTNNETFECVDGRCMLTCNIAFPPQADCNGAPDDGCEAKLSTNDNCGACGVKCTDPDKPCTKRGPSYYGCGCPNGLMPCWTDEGLECVTQNDDRNCGACGNVCDPEGGGFPLFDNTYYGCQNGTCGHLKCTQGFVNCDSDLENGCESSTLSNETCGGCGRACGPGESCAINLDSFQPFCACPDNKTFCGVCFGPQCMGRCYDLSSDANACGSCDVSCDERNKHAEPVCVYGSCEQRCPSGRADCNGNTSDGCEVNTNSDPQNCGACGVACDAVTGQACVGGQCVVEPCDQLGPDGGLAR